MVRPTKQETPLKLALSEASIIEMLKDLMRYFDVEPNLATVAQKEMIAKKLADTAGEKWGWRYVHNVLRGSVQPGRKFTAAIMALGAQLDGIPVLLSQARPMNLFVVGNVKPGSVVLADSRDCANPRCRVSFIPKSHFQTHCNPACTVEHTIMKKAARRAQKHGKAHEVRE
jgi:hypothetical protein